MSYEAAIETIIDFCTTQELVDTAYDLACSIDEGLGLSVQALTPAERELVDAIRSGMEESCYEARDLVDNAIMETEFSEEYPD